MNEVSKRYLELQDIWTQNKDNVVLGHMLSIIGLLSMKLTKQYCGRNRIYKSSEEIEDIVSKVQIRILERYRNNTQWRIHSNVLGSVYFDFFKVITNKCNNADIQQGFEDRVVSLEDLK